MCRGREEFLLCAGALAAVEVEGRRRLTICLRDEPWRVVLRWDERLDDGRCAALDDRGKVTRRVGELTRECLGVVQDILATVLEGKLLGEARAGRREEWHARGGR